MLTLLDGKTALCPVDPKWAFGQRQKWPGGVACGHSDQIDSLKYQSKINTNLVSHSLTFYFLFYSGQGPAMPWRFGDGEDTALRSSREAGENNMESDQWSSV